MAQRAGGQDTASQTVCHVRPSKAAVDGRAAAFAVQAGRLIYKMLKQLRVAVKGYNLVARAVVRPSSGRPSPSERLLRLRPGVVLDRRLHGP